MPQKKLLRRLIMKKDGAYIANCVFGSFFGFLLYETIIFSIQREFVFRFAMIFSLLGFAGGIALNEFLKRKHEKMYFSSNFNLWALFLVQINMFLGSVFGFFVGMLVSWLFLYPYSLLFGHPESGKWTHTISYSFQIIIFCIVAGSSVYFLSRFAKGWINYCKRRSEKGDEERGHP